jgi:hypothetical protein
LILSIHQPNFLPWIGYFNKIIKSDIFIILDSVQYPRGKTVANHCQIKTANGIQDLVVPLSRKKNNDSLLTYNEIEFGEIYWYKKPLRSIKQAYSKAPYFNNYYENLVEIFQNESFTNMNIEFIRLINKELNINTRLELLSNIENISNDRNQRIVDLCKNFNASVYLSGLGGKNYNDEVLFKQNSIEVVYTEYNFIKYPQLHREFIPKLSIIDLLFNCGPDSKEYIYAL